jgi:hypothetical protein
MITSAVIGIEAGRHLPGRLPTNDGLQYPPASEARLYHDPFLQGRNQPGV